MEQGSGKRLILYAALAGKFSVWEEQGSLDRWGEADIYKTHDMLQQIGSEKKQKTCLSLKGWGRHILTHLFVYLTKLTSYQIILFRSPPPPHTHTSSRSTPSDHNAGHPCLEHCLKRCCCKHCPECCRASLEEYKDKDKDEETTGENIF